MRPVVALILLVAAALCAAWWLRREDAPLRGAPGREGATKETGETGAPEAPRSPPLDEADGWWAGPLRVEVVSAQDGAPIAGARVRAETTDGSAAEATTDSSGAAQLPDAEKVMEVRVRRRGYLPRSAIPDIDVTGIVVRLVAGRPVRGRVVVDGRPAAGAQIRVWDKEDDEEITELLTTDAEGRFEIPAVQENRPFLVVAALAGYLPVVVERTTADAVEIALGHGATLAGRVLDAADNPVAGARVLVGPYGTDAPWEEPAFLLADEKRARFALGRAVTDARGRYTMRGLEEDEEYIVYARTPAARGTGDSDVRMVKLASLTVRVLAPDGKELEDAYVVVDDGEDHENLEPGEAQLLKPGKYELHVSERGLVPHRSDIELGRGERREIDVRLTSGGELRGVVVDESGRPVVEATLMLPRGGGSTHTDEQGAFCLAGLPAGRTLVRVGATGFYSLTSEVTAGEPVRFVLEVSGRITGRLVPRPSSGKIGYDVSYAGGASGGSMPLDEQGRFVLWDPGVSGPLELTLEPENAAPIHLRAVVVERGETTDLGNLAVEPGVSLQGRVLDPAGRPVAAAAVEVRAPTYHAAVRTDADGRFRFEHQLREALTLHVVADGYPAWWPRVDPTRPVTVRLRVGGEIKGHVVDRDGRGVRRAHIVFFPVKADGSLDERIWWKPDVKSTGLFRVLLPAGRRCRPRFYGYEGRGRGALGPVVEVQTGEATDYEFKLPISVR
jgi:uncharacterized GH25 family protein